MHTKLREAHNAVVDMEAALTRLPLLVRELRPALEEAANHAQQVEQREERLAELEAALVRREELVGNRERQVTEREANSDERERTLATLAADLKRQQQAATVARR